MKVIWICSLVMLMPPICVAQRNTAVSSGPCNLIVQESKTQVTFTCSTPTPIAPDTVQRMNVLLSEIFKNQKTDTASTNKRLDQVIDLLAGTQSDIRSMAQSLSEGGGAQGFGDAHALGRKIVEQAESLELGYKDLTTTVNKLAAQPYAREQVNIASVRFYWDFRDCCRTYVIEMHDEAIHKLGPSVTTTIDEAAFNEIKSLEQNGAIDYSSVHVKIMYFGMFIPYFKHLGLLLEQML